MRKEIKEQIDNAINKYKTVNKTEINKKKFIDVKSYEVELNNGDKIYREKIVKNNDLGSSSSILPILKNGNIILVMEPRVFTKSTVEISMPGGYIDKDETPLEGARRELEEETSLISDNIVKVSSYYTDLGNSEYISNIFIAFDCDMKGNKHLDSDEYVELLEITEEELYELINEGMIRNASTIVAALKLQELKKATL